MVQAFPPGGPYPSRAGAWYPRTGGAARCGGDERSPESAVSSEAISQALRHYGVPGSIFVATADEQGRVVTHFTPGEENGGSKNPNHAKFFDEPAFIEACHVKSEDMQLDETEPGSNAGIITKSDLPHWNNSSMSGRGRKRLRASGRQRGTDGRPDALPATITEPKRSFVVGDADAVYAFYDNCLRSCQQTACKIIAKAWVKAVAPKKQSTNPYTRGPKGRPDWWPKVYRNLGENTYRGLRHKEPDHIHRDERVYLLCHILRMLVEPLENQHPAIRKVELTLSTLEAVTFEALSPWFGDKDSPANMNKKPLLRDLFRVAGQEAQFKDREIDANTLIYVTPLSDNVHSRELTPDCDDDGSMMEHRYIPVAPEEGMLVARDPYSGHGRTGSAPGYNLPESGMITSPQYSNPGFSQEIYGRPNYEGLPAMNSHVQHYVHGQTGVPNVHINSPDVCQQPPVLSEPATYGGTMAYSPWPLSHMQNSISMYALPPQSPGAQSFSGQTSHAMPFLTLPTGGLPSPKGHYRDSFASPMAGQYGIHQPNFGQQYTTEAGSFVGPEVKTERPLSPFRIKTENP